MNKYFLCTISKSLFRIQKDTIETAIMRNAASVVIAHNHPSGGLRPSNEDIQITKKLKKAGEIIGRKDEFRGLPVRWLW